MKSIKPLVFFPPFLLLLVAVICSHFFPIRFLDFANHSTAWIVSTFGWLFNVTSLSMVFICVYIYWSPIGKIKIGGEKAVPLLSIWRWFSILLCTTIAIGILFWGTAEPLFHFFAPPKSLNITPGSPQSEMFALSTMYMHWSFTPYCIYTIPALMAALACYNLKKPYSLSSLLTPLFGDRMIGRRGEIVDAICLFSLMAGMAGALGSGILTIYGGLHSIFDIPKSSLALFLIAATIVVTFCFSAASGLMKGIRILSDYNIRIYFVIAFFVLLAGPTQFILVEGAKAFGQYILHFFERSLLNVTTREPWADSWTTFYWANWMAWAPVTALFLGRLGYGYRVRTFLLMNAIFPAVFSCVWMAIFSGSSLYYQQHGVELFKAVKESGPEAAIYGIFRQLPLSGITILVFILTAFLSFVTAADSNTEAMSSLSTKGLGENVKNPPIWIKFVLGGFIGFFAWFMVSNNGIDGIKQLSNLGGLPALFLLILVSLALIKVASKPDSYIDSEK